MTDVEQYEENFNKIKELKKIAIEKLEQKQIEDFEYLEEQKEEFKNDTEKLQFINQRETELKKYYKEQERKIPKLFDELVFIIL